MTPEELDEARAKEAQRLWESGQEAGSSSWVVAARLARENWTPPEPVVDPDVLAFREWFSDLWGGDQVIVPGRSAKSFILEGAADNNEQAAAYFAGARMAREQEQERAKVLVESISDPRADIRVVALAKYRGKA